MRPSCLAWEAVIEERRSSANRVHQVRSSLNSRETASCIAANSWLKPYSSSILVRSEELAAKGRSSHLEGVKLTMIVETVAVDDRRKSEVVRSDSRRICVIDLSEF